MMKILFIGGTGNISSACTQQAIDSGHEVYHLNRGLSSTDTPKDVKTIHADINNIDEVKNKLKGHHFDTVVNFIVFKPSEIERDIELFSSLTDQYIFISTASVYQKPLTYPVITESTPLKNPFWAYSRDKIACEDHLIKAYREHDFPVTIIRPSHTYNTMIPAAIGGGKEYTLIDRIKKDKKILVHGDGTSLWTLTHASDFAKGLNGLAGNPKALGHAFHITSDEVLSWNQIYETIGKAIGKKPELSHVPSEFICDFDKSKVGTLLGDKAESAIFDNSKLKTFVPEFKAETPFFQGIRKTIQWFEEKQERMIINDETNHFMDQVIDHYEKTRSK